MLVVNGLRLYFTEAINYNYFSTFYPSCVDHFAELFNSWTATQCW